MQQLLIINNMRFTAEITARVVVRETSKIREALKVEGRKTLLVCDLSEYATITNGEENFIEFKTMKFVD